GGGLGSDLVQLAGIALFVAGVAVLVTRVRPLAIWRAGGAGADAPAGSDGDEAAGELPDDSPEEPVSVPDAGRGGLPGAIPELPT
ncbi:MAG: hypothetical protein M0Z62_12450, partial [Actinomycetota bacterium]|nr:hypothetical protein [Actinomycetota bacterium]